MMPLSAADDQPILCVVRGDATPEEIAALVAVACVVYAVAFRAGNDPGSSIARR